MITFAKKYKEFKLNCLPTKEDKTPNISWQHLQKEKISDKEIEEYFNNSYGIGIICGAISGNLEVLDIDNHQNTAYQNLIDLVSIQEIKAIFEKYKFPVQKTQSGGYHIFYRCPKISGNQKIATVPLWIEELQKYRPDAIFETRGEGGYVVVSPTPNYSFIRGDIKNIPTITEEERELILNAARSFQTWITPAEKTQIENTGERLGDKYNEDSSNVYEIKNLLKNNGWQEVSPTRWRREGKKKGISATFGKVAPNVFYNFSANGYPFEPNKAYSMFSILAILKFNSDYKAAAKSLIDKYGNMEFQQEKKAEKPTELDENNIKEILKKRKIDKDKRYSPPIPILSIRKNYNVEDDFYVEQPFVRLMTEGNISVVTGKAKSKKTFLQIVFASSLISGSFNDLLKSNLKKPKIIYLDTEQSTFDVYLITERIKRLTNYDVNNLDVYNLRGLEHNENIELLKYICKTQHKDISVIFIDQVADFLRSVNNEEEAVQIVKLLEKLTYDYSLHISCVVHQNKLTDFATGWLGTMLMKKAETIIKVSKDPTQKNISIVEADMMRGEEFEPFNFHINASGLPELIKYYVQPIQKNDIPF